LLSVKLHTDSGERWAEGTVFAPDNLRLASLYGIPIEAPLGGTLIVIRNDDQPGVIGDVGTILGRRQVNIANFALGRDEHSAAGAVGVVNVDESPGHAGLDDAVGEIRALAAVRDAWVIRLA
jgi:D-3-phosphoglycerate dehydrogenase